MSLDAPPVPQPVPQPARSNVPPPTPPLSFQARLQALDQAITQHPKSPVAVSKARKHPPPSSAAATVAPSSVGDMRSEVASMIAARSGPTDRVSLRSGSSKALKQANVRRAERRQNSKLEERALKAAEAAAEVLTTLSLYFYATAYRATMLLYQ